MKRTIIAALLATTAGTAFANSPFDFQRQIGSEEYVHGYDAAAIEFAAVAKSGRVSSLEQIIEQANVDGIAANRFDGVIVASGPTRVSLYEAYRGGNDNEYAAYSDYHERFPLEDSQGVMGLGNVADAAESGDNDS